MGKSTTAQYDKKLYLTKEEKWQNNTIDKTQERGWINKHKSKYLART